LREINRFWKEVWIFTENFYKWTGLRIQSPIEWVFPDFSPWLFGKMIGFKGEKIEDESTR
jgi:hypothetical protein